MTTDHHAERLAAYARCQAKYGPDPLSWLPSLIAVEGLTMNVGKFVERVTMRTIDEIVHDHERRGLPIPDDDALTDLVMQHPVMIALMADELVTRHVTKRVVDQLADDVFRERIAEGTLIPIGSGRTILHRDHYNPEVHGPVVPYVPLVE